MVMRKLGTAIAVCGLMSLSAMSLAEEKVLLQGAELAITAEEFRAFARGALTAEQLEEFAHNEQRGRELLSEFYVMRVLEHEARQQGMDKDPLIQLKLRQGEMRLLANERLQALADAAAELNYDELAREAYLADRNQFKVPERVAVEHILVGINDERDDVQALARAKEVLAKLKGGADFATLATEYSDDPSVATNKGDMGYFARGRMVKPFEDAAFAMSREGELSEPVKTQFGYHVIRFKGRKAEGITSFEDVKPDLIEQAKARHMAEVKRSKVALIRADESIKVDHDAVSEFFREQAQAR